MGYRATRSSLKVRPAAHRRYLSSGKESPSQPTKTRIVIAFACVYFFWGSTYGAIHIAGEHLAPPLVGAMRSLGSTVILAVLCLSRGISLRVPRRSIWKLALVGILFMTANNVMLVWGETKVPSGYASLIVAMMPIMIALLETGLPGGETLNLPGWLGTMAAVFGITVLVWPSLHQADNARNAWLGFVILALAALAFAVGSVISRRFRFEGDALVATAWQIGAAGLVNLTLASAGGCFHTAVWTRSGVLAIVYLSLFGSVIGLTAYTYLLQHVPITTVSTYAFINPVIAVLIGVVLFHERLSLVELAGMMLILGGVATVILTRRAAPSPPTNPLLHPPLEE